MEYPKNKEGKFIHRQIAEYLYKRKIETDEEVHHIDGCPDNFHLENLIIIKKSDHEILTNLMRNKKLSYPRFKHIDYYFLGKNSNKLFRIKWNLRGPKLIFRKS